MEIQEIIEIFVEKVINKEKFYSLLGTIESVDETARTCIINPIGDEAQLVDVRLQGTTTSTTGVVLVPAVGSVVGVSFVNPVSGFVSLHTEVDKVLIDTASTLFNGGDNGGLINISDLITKMNALETDLNTIKAIFTAWVTSGGDGGAALKAAAATWAADLFVPTLQTEIEDTKIKH